MSHLAKFFFALILLLLQLGAAAADSRPTYTMYTGSARGTYYQIANDLVRACPALDINVVSTDGSLDNLNSLIQAPLIKAGNRFAFVQNDVLNSVMSSEPIAKQFIKPVMTLYNEDIQVLVYKGSGITKLSDLNGKRVAVGVPGSGAWFTANAIRAQLGIQWTAVERSQEESILGVLVGDIDALIAVGGSPIKMFNEMGKFVKDRVALISLSDTQLNRLYESSKLPAGTYLWQDNVVELRQTRSSLVTSKEVTPAAVDALFRCINANIKELRRWGHPKWQDVQLPPKPKK